MTSAAQNLSSPVGVIAGGGAMPFAVADSLAARGIAVVILALKGACDPAAVARFRHHWIAVGQLGKVARLLRSEGCREVMFIGSLARPSLSEIRLDWGALRAMGDVVAAFRGGDDHLLSGIGRIFERDGFRMIGVREAAPDLLMPKGCVTRAAPDAAATADIARGREVLAALGPFDIGQATVVIDGHVVAVEDIEGTDGLLARVARLRERRTFPRQARLWRAGEDGQERPGFALRPADRRSSHRRRRCRRRSRRHCGRRRNHHCGRAAGHDRFRRQGRPVHHGYRPMSPARPGPDVGRKIFLIATEESGDRLGANLMKVLRQRLGGAVQFEGVGGRAMAIEGLTSLFPIEELSIIGFAAVVRQLPAIMRRIRESAEAVIAAAPDILVIIDSPDFTHRVAKRVRVKAPRIPIVDYVSPTVWAWRPGRARAMKPYIDHVMALLPFEPETYEQLHGPPCSYVGHPLTEQIAQLRPNAEEQRRRDGSPPVLLILPGSRRSEIKQHMTAFGMTLTRLQAEGTPSRRCCRPCRI